MALLPLHRFSNGTVDEPVDAFALSFCVLLDLGVRALFDSSFNFIIVVCHVCADSFLLSF